MTASSKSPSSDQFSFISLLFATLQTNCFTKDPQNYYRLKTAIFFVKIQVVWEVRQISNKLL